MFAKKRYKYFLSVFFLFFANACFTQVKTDSLKKVWQNKSLTESIRFKALNSYYPEIVFSEPDLALETADYHFTLAQKTNTKNELVNALKEKAKAFYVKGLIEKSETYLQEAIAIQSTLNEPINLARLNANLANILREQNKLLEAVKTYNLSLKIFKEKKETFFEAEVLNNLGLVYYDILSNDIALDYFDQALVKYEKLNLQDKISNIWKNKGAVYYQQADYKKSVLYLEKALSILEVENNPFGAIDCYYYMSFAYYKTNKMEKAFLNARKCLKIALDLGNQTKVLETQNLIGNLYLKNNLVEATKIGENILSQLDKDSSIKLKATTYELLYKCYKEQGKSNESLAMYEKYIVYNDSLSSVNNNIAILKHEIDKEYSIKLNENNSKNLKVTYGIVAFAFFLLGLILYFFRKNTIINRIKRDQLLQEINELKKVENATIISNPNKFELDRTKIEENINQKLNETDWNVLTILLDDPVISNKEIAEKAFMSVDGIGSSLRRMYQYFDIKESKYKKISLLMEAIKRSK